MSENWVVLLTDGGELMYDGCEIVGSARDAVSISRDGAVIAIFSLSNIVGVMKAGSPDRISPEVSEEWSYDR